MQNHQIIVPESVWIVAQRVSGQKVPGSLLREVLIQWASRVENQGRVENQWPTSTASATNLDETNGHPASVDTLQHTAISARNKSLADSLISRKVRLGCRDHPLDKNFSIAWAWVCHEFGSEREVVEYLEEQVALPYGAMTNPRGVIIARWKEAGSPQPPFNR